MVADDATLLIAREVVVVSVVEEPPLHLLSQSLGSRCSLVAEAVVGSVLPSLSLCGIEYRDQLHFVHHEYRDLIDPRASSFVPTAPGLE